MVLAGYQYFSNTCASYCVRRRKYYDTETCVSNSIAVNTRKFGDILNSSAFLLKTNTFYENALGVEDILQHLTQKLCL
jgi:hypothetical protein